MCKDLKIDTMVTHNGANYLFSGDVYWKIGNRTKVEEIDSNFFANMNGGAHVKGHKKAEGRLSDKNKRKKKLRNVYAELDPKRHGHE